ncbi:hypothetical protein CI610_02386 [invertebrate metagenome]|uniref:Helix-turn-helix domain-containing protein n=1 Tax=invertebrate metagenome TaxID=1711999 RepID=A0A2H9T631_9ZZZZ
MKAILPIVDDAVLITLKCAIRYAPQPYVRERAQAVMLSHRGFSLSEMTDVFDIQYQTVSRWLDDWENNGIRGLYKDHNGGPSRIYNPEEVERFRALLAEEPRRIGYAKAALEQETKKMLQLQR